uniref:Coiled-coil domain-containing protein 181 n=1 Tax=Sipha flava TaxID=143950 RepID=A0A2S2QKI8_9HEMI
MYSSTSFSRSFSFESDDPMFINVIESGDEFKTIMNRNNKTRQGSAIDEHVTYFPELFTHTQYKMYENCGKTLDDSIDDVNIYVPKKLNAEELRNKLKEISKVRKKVVTNEKKVEKPVKKVSSFTQNFQKKIKHTKTFERRIPPQPQPQPIKPRMTYYFELDPKGKLKPLNKNNISETNLNNKSTKFFHINLKATNNDENSKPRITKTPNTDLFLEFQTDKSGNKGAKLVIKKKPTEEYTASSMAGAKKSVSTERPRLPGYNGLRSEYGLSAEQLLERQNKKMERERRRKELKQKKHEEEQKKRVENEKNFYKWLQQKKQLKKPVKTTRHSYPMNRLTVSSARTSLNCIHNSSQRKGSFALEELLKINDEKNRWFKI